MGLKIEDVVPFGDVVRAAFMAYHDEIIAWDADFADPWVTGTFDVQKQNVSDMVTTAGLRGLKKGKTSSMHTYMDNEKPLNIKLAYAIDKCIAAGTITDSKASFEVAAFNKSIDDRNIGAFHDCYQVTMGRINATGNTAALAAKGFSAAMKTALKDNHDSAWLLNTARINVAQDINTLSGDDKILVDTLMASAMSVIKAGHAYALSIGDKVLAKKFTFEGMKKSVEPTAAKKPRNLTIAEFASRVVVSDVPAKYRLQMTLLTKDANVIVCRQVLKTGTCSTGTTLTYNVMTEVVKKDLTGTGEKIVITNMSGKKVKVKFLKIAVA